MTISSHRNEASLRNYIDRPTNEQLKACSDILFNALSGRPHQSLQLSSTALSCRAIFMFLWIRQSFIHKTHALSSSFSKLSCEKICVFFLSRILLNISPPDFVLETKKIQAKGLNSTLLCSVATMSRDTMDLSMIAVALIPSWLVWILTVMPFCLYLSLIWISR